MTRRLALAAAAALLGACAHLPVGTDGLSYDERRARLESVESWEMRGRLAVTTSERGFQGSFSWRQTPAGLDLAVRGPLRNGVLQVTGTPNELTVTARGDTRVLSDPEADLSALVGWWLPVGSLHAWLLGLPDRQFRADTELGGDGTLRALEQRLWRVEYASYQLAAAGTAGPALLVPRRIDLQHADLHLRLTIDDLRTAP